jgi:hypothetical protein
MRPTPPSPSASETPPAQSNGHVEVVDLRSLSVDTVHADQGVDLEVGDWGVGKMAIS